MRDIKFRAVTPVGIFHTPSGNFSIALHDTGHRVQMWSSDGLVDEFPATSIEQYTGLKDKNGTEIYEGDILYIAGLGNCLVGSEDGFFGFTIESKGSIENIGHSLEDIERIVGNIHENPDLINQ
jgi:uncharacterized phage protein (TIGR01671 family)